MRAPTSITAMIGIVIGIGGMSFARAQESAVTIMRDEWGVPHIYAPTEEGGYYGLGYAMSQDRFARLLSLVLIARGELASSDIEIPNMPYRPGPGNPRVALDAQNRLWRNHEMAEQGLEQLSPQLRRNYAAFAAGIRAYVAKANPAPQLSALARSVTVVDLVAIPRSLFYSFTHDQYAKVECGVGGMAYSHGMLPYQTAEHAPASNGWVVMPRRTAAGALILAADPHVNNRNAAYYEYEIQAGDLHSSGYAMGPALWQAHNEDVSWAMTQGNPDFLDCYEIATDPADPRSYTYDGRTQQMEVRTETIQVAGAPAVTREFEYVRVNGMLAPVIARRGQNAYVASAADMNRAGYLSEQFYRMNKAHSVDDLKLALATMSGPPQNITAGDRAGHALYIRTARVPIRPGGFDWTKPVPGNSSATAWLGYRTIDELVQLRDPAAGFMQCDNTAPDVVTVSGNVRARDYPSDLFFDQPGRQTSRGARTLQVLARNRQLTLDDAVALALDEMWVTAPDWIAGLRYAAQRRADLLADASLPTRQALMRLLAFDGQAHAESQAALDFYLWRSEANGPVAGLQDGLFIDWPWDRKKFNRELAGVLLTSLKASVGKRQAAYGDGVLRLGDVIRAKLGGADGPVGGITIDSAAVPLCVEQVRAVCERTMRAFGAVPDGQAGRYVIARGSQAMRIVQFTTPLRAYSQYAFGESDDPASPHFADQVPLYAGKKLKRAYFSREELSGHVSSEETLIMPPIAEVTGAPQ